MHSDVPATGYENQKQNEPYLATHFSGIPSHVSWLSGGGRGSFFLCGLLHLGAQHAQSHVRSCCLASFSSHPGGASKLDGASDRDVLHPHMDGGVILSG